MIKNMTVEIFIARHGQNEDNLNGILNGHRDLPLTELGREQARQLGEGIKHVGLVFDAVYGSPLVRAFETAEIAANVAGLPGPVRMDLLIERNFGIMTGKRIDEVEALCAPDIIKADPITYFLSPEGAETFPQLVERGQEVLDAIRAKHGNGKVLLVCHGDVGKMIYTAATGKRWQDVLVDFHFGNGELIDVSGSGEAHKLKLEQFNH
jgi:broad specificity phosphatase PhoE